MIFVVDKPRFERVLAVVRDDRTPQLQNDKGPFLRIEAQGERVSIKGREVEAEFSGTVYDEGVLFLRVTIFRRLLKMMTLKDNGTRFLTLQVNDQGLLFGENRLGFDVGDMLLYRDPGLAPKQHPEERLKEDTDVQDQALDKQGLLFGDP